MANFIGLVYATLKNEGIDTKDMSTDEAVKKYNELQKKAGGKAGEKEGTPAEQRRLQEKGIEKGEKSYVDDSKNWESGRYTGDGARYNKLYDIWEKHDNLIKQGKYSDTMVSDIEDELRNIGLNDEGIRRFNEDTNRETIKTGDDAISVARSLVNKPLYREGSQLTDEELQEDLRDAETRQRRAKAKLLVSDERAKAEGINKKLENERYYQAGQDITYIRRALKK